MAKFAVVPFSLINAHPRKRMDAAYWVPVMERRAQLGGAGDEASLLRVQRTYEALYKKGGLGHLIERAINFDKEKARGK